MLLSSLGRQNARIVPWLVAAIATSGCLGVGDGPTNAFSAEPIESVEFVSSFEYRLDPAWQVCFPAIEWRLMRQTNARPTVGFWEPNVTILRLVGEFTWPAPDDWGPAAIQDLVVQATCDDSAGGDCGGFTPRQFSGSSPLIVEMDGLSIVADARLEIRVRYADPIPVAGVMIGFDAYQEVLFSGSLHLHQPAP